MSSILSRSIVRPRIRSKITRFGVDDIYEIWNSDPLFYPAKPPAHWIMVAERFAGEVAMVPPPHPTPLSPTKRRPTRGYVAAKYVADRYRED